MKIGWYSAKQAAVGGSHAYRTPSGSEVVVTVVCEEGESPGLWDDFVNVGPVTDFIWSYNESGAVKWRK